MDMQTLFDNRLLISLVSAILGGLATRIFAVIKGRVQELKYTVEHERIGISVDDSIFGSVKAIWQGQELTNLYSSKITLTNESTRDFKDVVIKAYSVDTRMLTERVEIQGSTYIPKHTEEFTKIIYIEPGSAPTDYQINYYRTNREYKIIALNRGQKVILHYLTTVPTQNGNPCVWLDIQQEGLRAVYKETVPEVYGVPEMKAIKLGLIACLGILGTVIYFDRSSLLAATLTLVAGLFTQSIGAWIYKSGKAVVRFLAQ